MIKLLKKNIRQFIYNRRSNIDNTIKSNSYLKKNDLTFYIKTFGPKNPNIKFYVIQRAIGGGMFSNLNYVIHHIKIALELKCIPIIDMKNYPSLHNEIHPINKNKNAWEYYFKKINKYSLNEVYKSKNVYVSSKTFQKKMFLDMTNNEISRYFSKIKIKKEILQKINIFNKEKFKKNDKILGVHFRGSTYKTARGHGFPLTKKLMIKNIQSLTLLRMLVVL